MHAEIVNIQLRVSAATREIIDDQEFLPFGDRVTRLEELVRLARIGKEYEEGKIVKEVVIVEEKIVEKIVEVPVPSASSASWQSGAGTVIEAVRAQAIEGGYNPIDMNPKPQQISKKPEEMTNQELFGSHAPNTGEEKIRRAVQAIKTYNERQYSVKEMWMINTSTLKELTNCRTAIVEKYLKSDEGRLQVADYNLEKEMGYQHNRGKKGSVSDFVKLG